MISRPMMVRILTEAKMNSASPYIRTAKMLRQMTKAMMMVIHSATRLSFSRQYAMTRLAAEISAQRVMAHEYQ